MAEGGHGLNLSCSICFEEFKVPKMLPCGHTFCCQCVSKMADRNSSLKCPTCRKDIFLPVSGRVEDFPTNYALMSFIPDQEALNEKDDELCECTKHKTPMEFYCKSCEKQICAKCLLKDHKPDEHNIVTASDMLPDLSGELQKLEMKLQQCKEEEKLLGEKILKGRDHHQQDKERLEQEIKITLERQRVQLKKTEENLLNMLNKTVEGQVSTYEDLQIKYNSLQTLSTHIKENCKELNQRFQKLHFLDLEKVSKNIDHLKDAIGSMKTTCQSIPTNVGLNFVPARGKQFGRLTTVPSKPIILESTCKGSSQNPRRRAIQVHHRPLAGQDPEQYAYTTDAARMKRGIKNRIIRKQVVHVAGHVPLTAQMLHQAQPDEQKQMIGERLFSIIKQSHGELAGKLTGMLLEIDNAELLHMLEFPEYLYAKVDEALAVLAAHQQKK